VHESSWQLSGLVFQLAAAAWNADELAALGFTTAYELGKKTGNSVQLAVFERRHVVLVVKFDGEEPETLIEPLGAPRPAYCTALGKALLAYQDPSIIDAYLASTTLKALTPMTITSATRLKEELYKIHRTGTAIDEQEFSQGTRCIAAPILNFTNKAVAALGMVAPAARVSSERLSAYAKTLARFAVGLSKRLGYGGPYPPWE
jgi:DNA-binding IclR family transcriptional regulator